MGDVGTPGNIISGSIYGPSNELLAISGAYNESRTYNAMLQLTHLQNTGVNINYAYSATQNNGKITSRTDNVSGEQVVYTYDALNRLASAVATNNSWGQSYAYDGFGNLTDQNVIAGSAPEWHASYDPATNHGSCTDANGNNGSCSGPFGTWDVYDVENRLVETTSFEPGVQYAYAPGNKRVWRAVWTSGSLTTDEVTFWGVSGQKLAAYALVSVPGQLSPQTIPAAFYATQSGTNYYFGGKLIKNATGYVGTDRLGSIGKYYPYGQEKPSATTNGTEKFTGYFRDAETGLDYADQRYHSPGTGRFLTADPYSASAGTTDPGSWNRYAYTRGDPVNRIDRGGTCDSFAEKTDPSDPDEDPCGGGGGLYFGWDLGGLLGGNVGGGGGGCYGNNFVSNSSTCGGEGDDDKKLVQPTCDEMLPIYVQNFLSANDQALLAWDPTLAIDLVNAAKAAGIDPRLMASIATLESGHGKSFSGNNPFGLGPGSSYATPQAAIAADASALKRFIFKYQETSVSALYSGNGFIVEPKKPWVVIQYPAYCYGGKDGSQTAKCQAAGQTISGFLFSQTGNAAFGLRSGDPNNLLYPCP